MSILSFARTLLSPIQANLGPPLLGKYLHDRINQKYNNSIDSECSEVANFDADDRSEVIDYETSIIYMQSEAYKTCYGDHLVWELYRRRAKHSRYHLVGTRLTCIRNGKFTSSSPCPICRDKYLVLDYRNVKLLNQFISPHYSDVISSNKTGLCQLQHKKLQIEVLKAKDYGTISFDIPFRWYNYDHFQKTCLKNMNCNNSIGSL